MKLPINRDRKHSPQLLIVTNKKLSIQEAACMEVFLIKHFNLNIHSTAPESKTLLKHLCIQWHKQLTDNQLKK